MILRGYFSFFLLDTVVVHDGIHESLASCMKVHGNNIDGLVQERHNSSALAMELRLSFINPSICNPRVIY